LSFHTFQAMSYTIEVYRGNQKAERHFGIYALYVMFYPQLVAGPIERPQNLLHQFREKYDFYIIQDLKWTIHNAEYMKEHKHKYKYLTDLSDYKSLNITTVDMLDLCDINVQHKEHPVLHKKYFLNMYFIPIALKQLWSSLNNKNSDNILKNKFLRWSLGQMCFFEHYSCIPFLQGYKEKMKLMIHEISIENNEHKLQSFIKNFRYQWDYLMDLSVKMNILTTEEAKQYKEVFPIFDPQYITSYDDKSEDHKETMFLFIKTFK